MVGDNACSTVFRDFIPFSDRQIDCVLGTTDFGGFNYLPGHATSSFPDNDTVIQYRSAGLIFTFFAVFGKIPGDCNFITIIFTFLKPDIYAPSSLTSVSLLTRQGH